MSTQEVIYDLRTKNGLSQDELAEKVFVTRQAVSPSKLYSPSVVKSMVSSSSPPQPCRLWMEITTSFIMSLTTP